MPDKRRVNVETVEVENVTEVTQEVKPGLLDKVKSGVKNFWSKHKTKLLVGTALVGAGMLAGAKLAKEEDEEEVYLIEVKTELEDVEDISEDDESEEDNDTEETEEDNNEVTED